MSSGIMRVPRRRPRPADGEITIGQALGIMAFLSSAFLPRAAIIALWIFGSQLGDAFASWLIPCFGFFLLPWTTLTYALVWGIGSDAVTGWEWVAVGFALLLDLSTWLGGFLLVRRR